MSMTVDEVKTVLDRSGWSIEREERLNNGTGTQLRVSGGPVVNVFDKGTVNVQGKNADAIKPLFEPSSGSPLKCANGSGQKSNKVFVVYGHDLTARNQLEAMLRRWGLELLILDQLPSEGQTLIEKLESYTSEVGFAVVLATPDDIGYRVGHSDEEAYRARQNVVLELGMLLTKLGRPKVAILLKQQENMKRPSDIDGLIYIPFKDDIAKDAGVLLAKEMDAQGFSIPIGTL
jgi:predicted nucleotide-binding protein